MTDAVSDAALETLVAICRGRSKMLERAYQIGGLRRLCKHLDINPDA